MGRLFCPLLAAGLAAAFGLSPAVLPAAEPDPACTGRDVLAELTASAPDVAERIRLAEARTPNTGAELWKIEKPGVPTSYLLGTMHLADPRISRLTPPILAALAEASTVAVEVADMSSEATKAAAVRSQALMYYPDEQRLSDLLSAAEIDAIAAALAPDGTPRELIRHARPWLIEAMLAVSACERARTRSGMPVLDIRVSTFAKEHKLKLIGLETADAQIEALASVPETDQAATLKVALAFADRRVDLEETLIQLYLARRMGAIWPLNLELARKVGVAPEAFTSLAERLILARNESMAKTLAPLLAKGRVFVAVGALHLVGARGLVELIRARGYTLTPVD